MGNVEEHKKKWKRERGKRKMFGKKVQGKVRTFSFFFLLFTFKKLPHVFFGSTQIECSKGKKLKPHLEKSGRLTPLFAPPPLKKILLLRLWLLIYKTSSLISINVDIDTVLIHNHHLVIYIYKMLT